MKKTPVRNNKRFRDFLTRISQSPDSHYCTELVNQFDESYTITLKEDTRNVYGEGDVTDQRIWIRKWKPAYKEFVYDCFILDVNPEFVDRRVLTKRTFSEVQYVLLLFVKDPQIRGTLKHQPIDDEERRSLQQICDLKLEEGMDIMSFVASCRMRTTMKLSFLFATFEARNESRGKGTVTYFNTKGEVINLSGSQEETQQVFTQAYYYIDHEGLELWCEYVDNIDELVTDGFNMQLRCHREMLKKDHAPEFTTIVQDEVSFLPMEIEKNVEVKKPFDKDSIDIEQFEQGYYPYHKLCVRLYINPKLRSRLELCDSGEGMELFNVKIFGKRKEYKIH